MRLNVLDPRWIEFGFNQPGAESDLSTTVSAKTGVALAAQRDNI